jgi:putative phosphoesterase
MRLALIADVHSNIDALRAVLGQIEEAGVHDVVCLGDVVSLGPHPREALRRIRSLDCPVVMGNCDAFMLDPKVTPGDDEAARISASDAWTAEQLDNSDLDFIGSFNGRIEIELGEYSLLCYHGSPRSYDDVIDATTTDERLDELFEGYRADVGAGGHTHFQMLRRTGGTVLVNPGSVGMAYDRTHPPEAVRCAPWAEYAVVEAGPADLTVAFHRVPYDASKVASALRSSGMPHAQWLAEGWG